MSFLRRPLHLASLFLVLTSLLVSGCQTRYKISGIAIALTDIQPTAASSATGNHRRAVMTLRFFNDNIMPVAFAETTHKLYLGGTLIGNSTNKQALGIPPAGSTDREVFIEIDKPEALRELAAPGVGSAVEYRLESTVRYRFGNQAERIPVRSRGQVDISALVR